MIKGILKQIVVRLLEEEAKLVLKKYKPKIVAITGTVGKTSTKDAIHTALSSFYFVRSSQKSFNSEFGVPLTILNLPTGWSNPIEWIKNLWEGLALIILPNHYPEWLVLEVGTDKPGDIARATSIISPDIVVVTKLAKIPVHVENFPSPEAVFEEKGKLVTALKRNGTLILNAEDEDVLKYKNLSEEKVILFGNANGSDVRMGDYEILYNEDDFPRGVTFDVQTEQGEYPVFLPGTLGAHHAMNALAASAVCVALGEHLSVATKALSRSEPTKGRMRIIEGLKDSIIIDDTYNASPVAVEEALHTLKSLTYTRRKIAVLGDMLELGRFSIDAHKQIGKKVAETADFLVTVGVRARYIAEEALNNGLPESNVLQFDAASEAGDYIQNIIQKGDAILVKGSQGVRMERVVEEIMLHPEQKEKLLVRQDVEWKKR